MQQSGTFRALVVKHHTKNTSVKLFRIYAVVHERKSFKKKLMDGRSTDDGERVISIALRAQVSLTSWRFITVLKSKLSLNSLQRKANGSQSENCSPTSTLTGASVGGGSVPSSHTGMLQASHSLFSSVVKHHGESSPTTPEIGLKFNRKQLTGYC